MGLMEVGAKCQLPAEDENLPSLHRHTPDLHLHPCNDIQMCSDVICPGQREKSEQKTIAPFGEKLMILVNPVAWGTAHTRAQSLAIGTRRGWGHGTAGWEVNRLVKHIWLEEPWAHCELLSQLRSTLWAPSAGESESPFHPGVKSSHTASTINYCASNGNMNNTQGERRCSS